MERCVTLQIIRHLGVFVDRFTIVKGWFAWIVILEVASKTALKAKGKPIGSLTAFASMHYSSRAQLRQSRC